jgi:uncharacterized repeat protein (TIGR01451 family)
VIGVAIEKTRNNDGMIRPERRGGVRRKGAFLRVRARGHSSWQIVGLACLAAAMLSLSASADRDPRSLTGGRGSSRNEIFAEFSGTGHIHLRATLRQPDIHRTEIAGQIFQELMMADEGVTAEVGKPRLPVIRRLVEIPLGAEVILREVTADDVELDLSDVGLAHPIAPVQPPVPKIPGAGENASLVIDEAHYARDEFWPPDLVRVRDIGILRQSRLAMVEIFPVRYNPQRERIRLCSGVQFDLILQGGDAVATRAHRRRYTNGFTGRWNVSDLFIESEPNPRPMDGWSETPVTYLMVVPDEFYEAIKPLADWKRQEGFEVILARISQTGETRDDIKNYIQNAYDTWEVPPTFLLLVGDSDRIPPYTVGGITTDLYYTTMSAGDYLPDIQIGRLSVADSSDLNVVVQKIIGHEMGLWENDDGWTRRGYFMASNDGWYHEVAEGTQDYCMQLARTYGLVCDSLYEYYHSGTPIPTALNDGRTMAVYSGHGSYYSWQGPTFTQDGIEALDNGQMYPLVCSHACNTGGFHKSICFGETWLRTPGKGSAAFWGSSVSSYWDEDDILQRSMFDALFDSTLTWLAGMMDQAKLELYVYYGGGGLSESYFRQYNLLGDPAMYLWTRPPKTLVVEHDEEVPIGSSVFMAAVREPRPSGPSAEDAIKSAALAPVDGALVSVIAGDGRRGLAGSIQGQVSVALQPALIREEPLQVAASKPGYRPYVGTAEVKAHGPYLVYGGHEVDDSAGNGDGQINAGETVRLTVTIDNNGNEVSQDINALLSESDPYVQLSSSSADYGDIDAKSFAQGSPPYECHISEFCPDGHLIEFSLTASDNAGRKWFSQFEVEVVTPDVVILQHEIQDLPPGGNDNGVAEPGETVSLVVLLTNRGLAAASGVVATVISLSASIEVLVGSAEYGDLAPQTPATGTPAYRLFIDEELDSLLSFPLVMDIRSSEGYATVETLNVLAGIPGFDDDVESGQGNWAHAPITQDYVDDWHLSHQRSHSDSTSWKCGHADAGSYSHYEDAGLVTPPILLAEGSVLTFWHWIEAEVDASNNVWDGGLVEISSDGGAHWTQITPVGGYPYEICENAPSAGSPLAAGTPCFSGFSDWKEEEFDLAEYDGLVQLRFRFSSDQYTEEEGWYIDDINVDVAETMVLPAPCTQMIPSGRDVVLVWAPVAGSDEAVQYEIYRSADPFGPPDGWQRMAVVAEPSYTVRAADLQKDVRADFFMVVAVDTSGRRSSPSRVVGRWRQAVR